jgi:pimeloyl-ACP methyl ester carboxylesterase
MSERDVTLLDGRTLHVYEDGDPDGAPLVVHHGTPGSGLLYGPQIEDARARGLRLIGYDRAGYGGSTPKPGRTVADIRADIENVLDELGVDRFASIGASGGGPHSLALGVLLPDRCVAVCAVAAVAPWEAEGLDWLAGQGEQNREEWAAALAGPAALEPRLEQDAADLRDSTRSSSATSCRRSSLEPTAPSSQASWPRSCSSRPRSRSSPASRAGATTTSRSRGPGASTSPTSGRPCSSGRACRT